LRARVLHLEPALAMGRLRLDMRIALVGARGCDAHAPGRERSGNGVEFLERLEHARASALQNVGSEIDRRPLGQRPPLFHCALAKGAGEGACQPFGIVARIAHAVGCERASLFGCQRARPMLFLDSARNVLGRSLPDMAKGGEHQGAGRVGAHAAPERALPAQHVIDQRPDRMPVTGAGETMRPAPVLERF
jgi:hypothetical protein